MSVAFEPAPLGRRGRGPDRAAVLALVVVAWVAVAVAKPWAAAAGPSTLDGGASPPPGSPAAPSASTIPAATTLAAALPPHDAWGVRVVATPAAADASADIVRLADGTAYSQRWSPAVPVPSTLAPDAIGLVAAELAVAVAGARGAIRSLGITSPSSDPALDLRVWRAGPDPVEPGWLDVPLPVGDLGLGEWLLGPPVVAGRQLGEWPSGTYYVDVLRARSVGRLIVVVPEAPARPMDIPPDRPYPIRDREAGGGWPPASEPGPVGLVIADGTAIVLPGRLGPPLDERGAWLGADSAVDPAPAVVRMYAPDATGIGLRFPPRATSIEATLVWLAPSSAMAPVRLRTGAIPTTDGDVPWAIVDAPTGQSYPPGSYRLDVAWRDGTGDRRYGGSIHLELAPGPPGLEPRWLSAARGMARWAGSNGFVVGISARIEGASTDSLMRLLPERPGAAPRTVEALGDTCGGAVIADAGDAVIGLAHGTLRAATDVRMERLFAGGRRLDVPVRVALEPVPGLVLLAPAEPGAPADRGAPAEPWAPGMYDVTLSGAGWSERSVVCLAALGSPLHVPAEATSVDAWSRLASPVP